jgi:hypothetical protein
LVVGVSAEDTYAPALISRPKNIPVVYPPYIKKKKIPINEKKTLGKEYMNMYVRRINRCKKLQ